MNIVKFGGSIVNPDGNYNHAVINEFIGLVKARPNEKFIFVVGGGKICRLIQDACKPYLQNALENDQEVSIARDEIGIATTKVNARYVLLQFQKELGEQVHGDIIRDPTRKVESSARIFFACGFKPGCSTDNDMMLLAKAFDAEKVFKISNFEKVKRFSPKEYMDADDEEKERLLKKSPVIDHITWEEFSNLIGDKWVAGMSTPLDPKALKVGLEKKQTLTLYIGPQEEFFNEIQGKGFNGTIVRG